MTTTELIASYRERQKILGRISAGFLHLFYNLAEKENEKAVKFYEASQFYRDLYFNAAKKSAMLELDEMFVKLDENETEGT